MTFALADAVSYSASAGALVVADVNRDGKLDVATSGGGSYSVLLGNGDGTLQTARTTGVQGPSKGIGVGDFNSDQVPDLVLVDTFAFSTLLGKGDGTFGAITRFAGTVGDSVTVTDLDQDGHADVVMASSAGAVYIGLGKGNNTFQPTQRFSAALQNDAIVVADLNKDGILDVATSGSGFIGILLGNKQTLLDLSANNFPVEPMTRNYGVAVGDINGDGTLDLVTGNSVGVTVSILFGNGNGSFQPEAQVPCGDDPHGIQLADLNLDGNLDIVETNSYGTGNPTTVGVILGKGGGQFEPFKEFPIGASTGPVAVADLNGDGLPDIIVDAGTIQVFLNTSK
jgi:hypothetical protein